MSQKVYILGYYAREAYEEIFYDADIETEMDYHAMDTVWHLREDGVPPMESIVFSTMFVFLNAYEYLDNNCGWTIVSQRMLDAIRKLKYGESVAAFPVTMIDSELIEPPEGYPPIFRIKEYLGNVFVTEELRQAWKAAGVRGPVYRPLYNTWLTYEMDFPIEIEGENIWAAQKDV
jgi:hypothetical protein